MTVATESRFVRWRLPVFDRNYGQLLTRYAPALFAVLNAVAFLLVRPDVNDLWAARARASAVRHGVGLTYWFAWFSGGSTPGNYSVLTPFVSAYTSAELLGALSAIAIPVLCVVLLRGTAHPIAGTSVAALAAGVNLWSGRVPFLFGAVFAVASLIALRRRKTAPAVILTVLSVLASPVTGVFTAVGLSGVFLSYREYRRISLITIIGAGAALGAVALVFGAPGPEPFSGGLLASVLVGLVVLQFARPSIWLRSTIWVAVIATAVLAVVPNGMGSNFARLAWYCLPAAVVALSKFRTKVAVLIVLPALVAGTIGTVMDVKNAGLPISKVSYYKPLAAQLDTISGLENYRVEVVSHGSHAAYDALLDHAVLARGWETQEDMALNQSLRKDTLDPVTYKVWLDNNAVGYIALPSMAVANLPEYDLVRKQHLSYLTLIWHTEDWKLYEVKNPTPIVPKPARLVDLSQSHLTIEVPCACTLSLRIRWSKFLHAEDKAPGGASTPARVIDDGSGWTTVTTTVPGTYVLRGSLSGGLLR
jgi:hypothetical protein